MRLLSGVPRAQCAEVIGMWRGMATGPCRDVNDTDLQSNLE
jgi:hypothetical protein